MFTRFRNDDDATPDVKGVRDRLLRFMKGQLQQWEGGEGGNIRTIHLYLFCPHTDRPLYEAAVYYTEPGRFQQTEVQRIADDYGIELPADWQLELVFAAAPADASAASDLPAALMVSSRQRRPVTHQLRKAYVLVQQGETGQQRYSFDAASGSINIGRDAEVQAADGFYRQNRIAFVADSSHEANKFVSRQHAHIEWSEEAGAFQLFADEGGIPPRNKVKVRTPGAEAIKLQSTHIGYTLQHGDQIILGDSALLEFGYEA